MARRVVLADHLAKLSDRGIDIEAGGEVFHIPPPQMWPDAVDDAIGEAAVAKVVFGEDRYAEFVAAGGNARIFGSIVSDGFDATVPE